MTPPDPRNQASPEAPGFNSWNPDETQQEEGGMIDLLLQALDALEQRDGDSQEVASLKALLEEKKSEFEELLQALADVVRRERTRSDGELADDLDRIGGG